LNFFFLLKTELNQIVTLLGTKNPERQAA